MLYVLFMEYKEVTIILRNKWSTVECKCRFEIRRYVLHSRIRNTMLDKSYILSMQCCMLIFTSECCVRRVDDDIAIL